MSTSKRNWKGPRRRPATLPDAPCYVLWRYGSTPNGKGKYPKVPFSPHQGADGKYHKARMDNAATWGTWAACMTAAADWRGWFDGIGIVLQNGDVGIDLDDGIDSAQADALLEAARGRAYIEQSVSGKGWHIIALGTVDQAVKTDTIEIYPGGSGRYFALGVELEGSARPAPAQDAIDQAAKFAGAQTRTSAKHTNLRLVETIATTPELASAVRDAQAQLADLLRELPSNLTPQLADLVYRGVFPPALKDTSASGARAVVVAQLHRAPHRRYSDAQIFVLARELWRRKGWEGAMQGRGQALAGDCWRLIALYRPGAASKPAAPKRSYQDAPDPLVYLARLAEEAMGDVVLLSRDERAALVGCPRPTAQRTEQHLVELGLVELFTYTLSGPGTKGRRGALRITPAGRQALARNESVIFSASSTHDLVTENAKQSAEPSIAPPMNTFVGDSRPAHPPRVLPAAAAPLWPIAEPGGASYSPALAERARHYPKQPPKFAAMRAKSRRAESMRELAERDPDLLAVRRWRLEKRLSRKITHRQQQAIEGILVEMDHELARAGWSRAPTAPLPLVEVPTPPTASVDPTEMIARLRERCKAVPT
jgi:hypothetical protein